MTRTTLFLVISCVMVLVGMVVPVLRSHIRASAFRTSCASNQCEIIRSALVYANDSTWELPCRPTDINGNATKDPRTIDGFCTAAASLELMMMHISDFPVKIFICPANPHTGRFLTAPGANGITYTTGISQWGCTHQAACAGGPGGMAYGYDWSSPKNADWIRIVLADRGNGDHAHRGIAVAAAADGHVLTVHLEDISDSPRPIGARVTLGLDGSVETMTARTAPGVTPAVTDDIYDDGGDGDMLAPGGSSTTRAWLR